MYGTSNDLRFVAFNVLFLKNNVYERTICLRNFKIKNHHPVRIKLKNFVVLPLTKISCTFMPNLKMYDSQRISSVKLSFA